MSEQPGLFDVPAPDPTQSDSVSKPVSVSASVAVSPESATEAPTPVPVPTSSSGDIENVASAVARISAGLPGAGVSVETARVLDEHLLGEHSSFEGALQALRAGIDAQ